MTPMKKTLLCLSLSLILTLVIHRGKALSMSHEEIFNWVSQEIGVDKDYPMPQIRIVSKKELQNVFRKDTEQSYQRWVGKYGEAEAIKTMNLYLKEVIGLFNPKTKVIYVGDFMEPCEFNSIVAHEMTHYLQVMAYGTADSQSDGLDDVYYYRELEASVIGNRYVKTHCDGADRNP
jgi:hypothetical protein